MNREKLYETLRKFKSAIVVSHGGPDEDAVTSMLFMKQVLLENFGYQKVRIFSNKSLDIKRFSSLGIEGLEDIEVFSKFPETEIHTSEVVVMVDNSSMQYLYIGSDITRFIQPNLIIIDHHDSAPDVEYLAYVNEGFASCTEQLYETFCKDGGIVDIKKDPYLSYLLQVGLIADSNNLSYPKTRPESFRNMADLREVYSLNTSEIDHILKPLSRDALPVIAHLFGNMVLQGQVAYTFMDPDFAEDLKEEATQTARSWVLNGMMRNIDGVKVALLATKVRERDITRISMRARECEVDLNEVGKNFEGGGHQTSAAATVNDPSPQNAAQMVCRYIIKTYPSLDSSD